MDIKSKNKYIGIIFIIAIYILGISVLSAKDLLKNKSYLGSEAYFNSSQFRYDLAGYFNNIQTLNGLYKDYSIKSDNDKVTKDELIASKTIYDNNLKNMENEIENKYKYYIDVAQNEGNEKELNRLIDAKNKDLNEMQIKNSKTLEDLKKEIVEYKNKDYENVKSAVNENGIIEYYITRKKDTIIDSNIENVLDIEKYIKDNALYSIKFPEENYNIYDELFYINQWFRNNGGEGYFIVPKDIDKNSSIYRNYNYYNSVKERLIKEIIIGIVSILIGLPLLLYILKKKSEEIKIFRKVGKWYNKVFLDIKIAIFISNLFIMMVYLNEVVFFYKPYSFRQVYILTIVAVYILYLIINVQLAINLGENKEVLSAEVKRCLLKKLLNNIRDNPILQSSKFRVRIMILLTLSLGIAIIGIVFGLTSGYGFWKMTAILSMIYILGYIVFMLFYIVKTSMFFSRISKGTEEIVLGNLNYILKENGTGDYFKIAHNINNMKIGFKKSLENEIRSERLKSELITNVSHDLKTPLTSIINYVDLLKKEGLSREETQRYISVLERKSQRLKILIDDLFEASKMASGAVDFNMEKVDVTSLLQQTLAELDEKINNSSLTFRLKMPKEKVYANLDGKRTWRVFENLINNVLKYSQPNSRVYIDLIEEDSKIIIIMKNMASYEMDFDKDEIFERFKRGDKSRNTEGSGLGLSIAKSIIELQGGNLSIEIDGDLFKAKVTVPSI